MGTRRTRKLDDERDKMNLVLLRRAADESDRLARLGTVNDDERETLHRAARILRDYRNPGTRKCEKCGDRSPGAGAHLCMSCALAVTHGWR